jgi:chromosome segregation ATPase
VKQGNSKKETTIMASVAAMEQEKSNAHLEAAVAKLDKEIERVLVDVADWRAQSQDANDGLQQLEEEYAKACTALAQKKGGADEPSKIQSRMQILRDRLVGIQNVIGERERTLNGLRAEIATLHAEQSQRAQARRIEAEAELTALRIAKAEKALADRDQAVKVFLEAVLQLRSHAYLTETSRRLAMDSAQSLTRRSNGMMP